MNRDDMDIGVYRSCSGEPAEFTIRTMYGEVFFTREEAVYLAEVLIHVAETGELPE